MDRLISKLNSEELEILFKESGYVEKSFFPLEVPSLPASNEKEDPSAFTMESQINNE